MNESLTILVVEDHDELRWATLSVLEQAGFEATGLSCAEEVDDLTLPTRPDVFLIDLNLPDEDGLSLVRRLREAEPGVTIVITTARTRIDDRIDGYDCGADIYLPKPVDPRELLGVLRALARRKLLLRGEANGELRLDYTRRVLEGPMGEAKLTEAEARVLAALSSAKANTLERWQVAAQFDPNSEDMSADNLQNRLSQLRKKLCSCGAQGESIRAIRNLGYRLCVPLSLL